MAQAQVDHFGFFSFVEFGIDDTLSVIVENNQSGEKLVVFKPQGRGQRPLRLTLDQWQSVKKAAESIDLSLTLIGSLPEASANQIQDVS